MSVSFMDLSAPVPDVQPQIDAALRRVQERGTYVLGPEVESFEREFAAFIGVRHCVGVGSGTDALHLILRSLGVGAGDEVIVPAYTAVATWMAVSMTGATPIGVDVREDDYLIDPSAIASAVTERTRVVLPVHLLGGACDIREIRRIIDDDTIAVVEDAAQAHGARLRGECAGSMGDAAAFSFYPTKNLGALGDGGAVTTNSDDLAERIRLLRSYGWKDRSVSLVKGFNSRLDELQAAVLRAKLPYLDEWNQRRSRLVTLYQQELGGLNTIFPKTAPDVDHVWHLLPVRVPWDRDNVRDSLTDRGVATLVHYDPLPHETPAYRDDGWRDGAFPIAERLCRTSVSLPLHPHLSADAVRIVTSTLHTIAHEQGDSHESNP